MVAQGKTNKAIAVQLSVSVRTVEGHVYKACMKLGLARPVRAVDDGAGQPGDAARGRLKYNAPLRLSATV